MSKDKKLRLGKKKKVNTSQCNPVVTYRIVTYKRNEYPPFGVSTSDPMAMASSLRTQLLNVCLRRSGSEWIVRSPCKKLNEGQAATRGSRHDYLIRQADKAILRVRAIRTRHKRRQRQTPHSRTLVGCNLVPVTKKSCMLHQLYRSSNPNVDLLCRRLECGQRERLVLLLRSYEDSVRGWTVF